MERKVERWITVNGKHILIYNEASADEKKKEREIAENEKEAKRKNKSSGKVDESKYKNVNPKYAEGADDPYGTNCQRCAYAFEANMRGEDVEANPSIGNTSTDPLRSYKSIYTQAFYKEDGSHPDSYHVGRVGTKDYVIDSIQTHMNFFGPDSRGILVLRLKNDRINAHVINVVNTPNGVAYIDAQIGKEITAQQAFKGKYAPATELIRVDNCEMNSEIAKQAFRKRR